MQGLKQGFWKLIAFLVGVFLFLGGLGVELFYIKVYGVLISILLIGLAWFWKGKVELPKTSKLYGLFLVLFLISLLWSKDWKFSFEHFLLFLSGGLFWIAFYNLSSEFGEWLDKVVFSLGIIFGGLFIINHYWGVIRIIPWSLFFPYTGYLNHNNIGDFWSILLAMIVLCIIEKPKRIGYWILTVFGTYFLLMSQSRSAYFALGVGVIYLFTKLRLTVRYRKIFMFFIFLAITLFLITGTSKVTLFARPYFIQAIVGLYHNPLGLGVGNFGLISTDPENWISGFTDTSIVVHNIFLEMIAGMGILGIVFAVWFVKIALELWIRKQTHYLVYRVGFVTLTANFFFHSTYFVPAMLWLWFMSLGIAQGEKS